MLEQVGVVGELGNVQKGEPFRALVSATHDKAGDLHHLATATRVSLGVRSRRGKVGLGFGGVPGSTRRHREEGIADRVHAATMRGRAYSTLTDGEGSRYGH